MDFITPDFGIIFWQTITFVVVLLILGKFAWKPILQILRTREEYIARSLQNAQEAQKIVAQIQEEQVQLLDHSKREREKILHEAKNSKNAILKSASIEAKKLSDRVLEEAREAIAAEKEMAFDKLKQEIGTLSIQVAEKLLAKELHAAQQQEEFISKLVQETKL